MLKNCPECELQVSDKAIVCPHCGYPLDPKATRKIRSSTKRKRLPNGFGQIVELKNPNLRKRFRASVTVGKTSEGRCIVKTLKPDGYFETYNEAYTALAEYNKNPYDLDDDITIKELYEKWSSEYFQTIGSSSTRTITSAWAYCSSIYDMRAKDLRARHIKGCMDDGVFVYKGEERHPSAGTKERIKSMFNIMLDYAEEYEIVDKNYARTFSVSDDIVDEMEKSKKPHISFTDDELNILWDNVDKIQYVDVILIQCYASWRPQELGLIELDRVDLDKWVFIGGIKTEAGINRLVPIHPKIRRLVEEKYKEAKTLGSKYLINCTDTNTHRSSLIFTYDKYKKRFDKIVDQLHLNPEHRPHDGRMTFITRAKKYKLDEYAIKYIAGHKIEDITERVYTEREISWLSDEMKKIK